MDQRIVIAQLDIDHLRRKLATEKDEAARKTIARPIFEEEAKLAALNDPSRPEESLDNHLAYRPSRQCVGCASMRPFV